MKNNEIRCQIRMEVKNTMEKIPKPYLICNFCKQVRNSKDCIRAKVMIIGSKIYPGGTVICKTCIEVLQR